jgi:hypothetical protein
MAAIARSRAVDALVNSSFLQGGEGAALSYLFKDMEQRGPITDPEQLLAIMDAADVGAAVISIMQPEHAEWVGEAHRRFPRKVLPAMIVDPTKGIAEVRRVVDYHERYGVRCLRIPPFRYEKPPLTGSTGRST